MEYLDPVRAGVQIRFLSSGDVEVSAFSDAVDFQFNVDRLLNEIRACEQEYIAPVRIFVFHPWIRRAVSATIGGPSVLLLLQSAYYLHASRVGVNVDPRQIPAGMNIYVDVDRAIKSLDVRYKLDVLLRSQLRGFINVAEVLDRTERIIGFALIGIAVACLVLVVHRAMRRLYPVAFFAFGRQADVLVRLVRKRDIWMVAIVIGFLVNVVAGLLIAIVT